MKNKMGKIWEIGDFNDDKMVSKVKKLLDEYSNGLNRQQNSIYSYIDISCDDLNEAKITLNLNYIGNKANPIKLFEILIRENKEHSFRIFNRDVMKTSYFNNIEELEKLLDEAITLPMVGHIILYLTRLASIY